MNCTKNKRLKRGNHLFAIVYGLLLAAFTGYVIMDTFVISRVYATVHASEASTAYADTAADAGPNDSAIAADAIAVEGSFSITNERGVSVDALS